MPKRKQDSTIIEEEVTEVIEKATSESDERFDSNSLDWYKLPIGKLSARVLINADNWFRDEMAAQGIAPAERDQYILESLSLAELYALKKGFFVANTKGGILLYGHEKLSNGKYSSPFFIRFQDYLDRKSPTSNNAKYSFFSLEPLVENQEYVPEVYKFAEKSPKYINVNLYEMVYGKKAADEIRMLNGKTFGGTWQRSTRSQKTKLLKLAYWELRDLVLNDNRLARTESNGPRAFWLESYMERIVVEKEMAAQAAKQSLEQVRKSLRR